MEFFDWLNVPQIFLQYFSGYLNFDISTEHAAAANMFKINLICMIVAAGLFVIGTVFCGIGLFVLAKKRGVKHGWMGFIPILNTYYVGKFAGEGTVFGKKIKNVGLWCMLIEIVFVALQVFGLVVNLMLISNPAYYAERLIEETGERYFEFSSSSKIMGGMRTLALAGDVVNMIASVWWFVLLFFLCTLYFAFFRKYYARSPFLMTFLCAIVPCRGFVLFAVRNNTPIDYNEYMRKRMEEERRRYSQQYGGQSGGGGNGGGDSPFPDFDNSSASGRDSDGPFSDF